MVSVFIKGLEPAISNDRLEAYRPPAGTDLELLTNYLWNMQLNEALYPSLHAAEVGFRNAIHAAASSHYQTEFWFDKPGVLMNSQVDSVSRARSKAKAAKTTPNAGHIVAELHFGFWVSLLYDPYERNVAGKGPPDRLYWHDLNNRPALLLVAFPHLTRRNRARIKVYNRFKEIKDLRNRVAHHEPIYKRIYLHREHQLTLEAIGWINQEMKEAITFCNRFPRVYRQGASEIEQKLKQKFGIV